jgi:hypothetical protein
MAKRTADAAFLPDPSTYAPVTMTTVSSSISSGPVVSSNISTAPVPMRGGLRARGVRGGRAPFSVPGHAPAYQRSAVSAATVPTSSIVVPPAQYQQRQNATNDAARGGTGGYPNTYNTNISTTTASGTHTNTGLSVPTAKSALSEEQIRKKKARVTLRTGGGEVWEDPTLAEWDPSKYSTL